MEELNSISIIISVIALLVSVANIIVTGRRTQNIWAQTQIMDSVLQYWETKRILNVIGDFIMEERLKSQDQELTPRWAMQVLDRYMSTDAGSESRNVRVAFENFAMSTVPLVHLVNDSKITSALNHQRIWAENTVWAWAGIRMDMADIASSPNPEIETEKTLRELSNVLRRTSGPSSMLQFVDIGDVIWDIYLPSRPRRRDKLKVKVIDQSHLSTTSNPGQY